MNNEHDPLAPFRRKEPLPVSTDQAEQSLIEKLAAAATVNASSDTMEIPLDDCIAIVRQYHAEPKLLEENEQLKEINAELLQALENLLSVEELNASEIHDGTARRMEDASSVIAKAQQEQTAIPPGATDRAISASSRMNASIAYIEAALVQRAETLDEAEAGWCDDLLDHVAAIKEELQEPVPAQKDTSQSIVPMTDAEIEAAAKHDVKLWEEAREARMREIDIEPDL